MTTNEHINARILKSTSIIGGSSALNIIFRIIQTKVAAVLLGPQGVGLMGLFNSVSGLASTLAGMGIATSGVREIAAAVDSNDQTDLARTVYTFRRVTLVLGIIGAVSVFILRSWISIITFGNTDFAASIGWLAVAVFFTVVSMSQTALIRGMRRIGDLARVSVLGIAIGTLLGIPMIYWLGSQGVVFYLIGVAGTTILVSWLYARRVQVSVASFTWQETIRTALSLLKLGLAFMSAGLITLAATYLVKVLVTRQLGVAATGLYEAASMIANVYVGFILAAMGADFFPHLSSVANDNDSTNQLVNSQVQIGVLLATPGILAVLAFGPWLLQLLYSAEFAVAFEILRWQALGTFLRLVSWPLSFLVMAKGRGGLYLLVEFVSNLIFLVSSWIGLQLWGLTGVGIAFFALYFFYAILLTIVTRQISKFSWGRKTQQMFSLTLIVVMAGFTLSFIESSILTLVLSFGLFTIVSFYVLFVILDLVCVDIKSKYIHRNRTSNPGEKTL